MAQEQRDKDAKLNEEMMENVMTKQLFKCQNRTSMQQTIH